MPERCPLHYTTDGDTLWLECFRDNPDAENGVIISAIEPGTSWEEVEALVAAHRVEHGSGHDTARSPAVDFEDWVTSIEASAEDMPALLRAVDAALELADRWDAASAAITGQLAALGAPIPPDADPGNPRARELREAITTALAGKEADGAGT